MISSNPVCVVMATGLGPLHFIESMNWIAKSGVRVRLILGWVPERISPVVVRLGKLLVGRDLTIGMRRRMIVNPPYEICTCALAEVCEQGLRVFCRLARVSFHRVASLVWSICGFQSRRYLDHADIFQVRSGAGQGGAIKLARRRGMKILVDHSALHPATCAANMKADYERWHYPLAIGPGLGVWKNVEADCKMADMIVVNADHIKDSFVSNGYDSDKIRVAYLGTRPDFFGIKKDYGANATLKVLYTGGFSILKGAEYLIESFRILQERNVKVECQIIGNRDVPAELLALARGLPIAFRDRVPQDELKQYLVDSDVYLFPSLGDGCARSGMEAMAAGLCVVATRCSGLPITDGVDGYVVPSHDAKAIADRIEWLANHPKDREEKGRAAAKLISTEYTWEKFVEKMTGVYRELLNRR